MKICQIAAAGVVCLGLFAGIPAFAQSANLNDQKDKTYGYVDLKTGLFHPATAAEVSPEATVAPKTYVGTIETTMTITIDSTLPKGTVILCDVDVSSSVDGATYTEVAASTATISGTKATCTVALPYSWTGPSGGAASSYFFEASYKVTASYVPAATQPITDFNVIRQTTGVLTGSVPVVIPATGTVTKYAIDPVI